jgi:outer membrane lipoprotein-sorting protein
MIVSNTNPLKRNGNRYTYSMSNVATNTAIADDTFVF